MRKELIAVALLLTAATTMAAIRTSEEAAGIAAAAMSPAAGGMHRSAATPTMKLQRTIMQTTDTKAPALYIFEPTGGEGFAVVSADDRAVPVLCYSHEGQLREETMPPAMRWWLNRFREELSHLPADAPAYAPEASSYTAIAPLLGNIAWDQDAPYNNYCPVSYYYPSERCLTGCVATATAQIMRYWEWPAQATGGTYTYTYPEYRDENDQVGHNMTDALNFDTISFDWANMPATYGNNYTAAQANAVATLMHACGVACDMTYASETAGGSGSWTDLMGHGLETYFSYKTTTFISMYSSIDYGTSAVANSIFSATPYQIRDSIYLELEAGRPVLMGGEDNENGGGHEFVCDGRDANGKLHINWGWSGDCNCYTAITSLRPTGTDYYFSANVDALLHLEPTQMDTVWATGIEVSVQSASMDINQTMQLTAGVIPQNATNKRYSWSSSNSSVATVDGQGKVTGVSQGTAYVVATSADGGYTDTCVVTVSNQICQTVVVNDTIYASDLSATTNQYVNFSGVQKASGAVYSGNTAKHSSGAIQMRAYNAQRATSAIYTTTSPGVLKAVSVQWNSATASGRTLQVYGENSAFGSCDAVHNATAIGSIGLSGTSYSLTSELSHLGLMVSGGAAYMDYIVVTWEVQRGSNPTGIEQAENAGKARKMIRDGRVMIERDGVWYDVLGRKI